MAKEMKTRKPGKKTKSGARKDRKSRVRLWFLDDELKQNDLPKYVDRKLFKAGEARVADPAGREDLKDLKDFLSGEFLDADVVLLDHQFKKTPPLAPPDGAGYVSYLRSLARRDTTQSKMPPIVILTAEEEAFAREVPAVGPEFPLQGSFVGREAFIAPTLDVEWILFKGDDGARDKISSIAEAYAKARNLDASNGVSLGDLCKLMDLPKSDWRANAIASIERARPPISANRIDSARGPAGVIRWLLHHALRFPGVLLSDLQAACSLGIDEEDLEKHLKSGKSATSKALKSAVYTGALHDMADRRWWSAAIDALKWRGASRPRSGSGRHSGPRDQVVFVDAELIERGIAPIDDCLPIQPRGWPPDAMQPFMKTDDLKSNRQARAMVDPNDQRGLSGVN